MAEFSEQSKNDIIHREMYLRSTDLVLVFNPTEFDHVVHWNRARGGISRVVPNRKRSTNDKYGAGYETLPAYLGWQYCKEMAETILNQVIKQEIDKENLRRRNIPGSAPLVFEGEGSEKMRFEERVRNEHKDLVWSEFDRLNPTKPPTDNPNNQAIMKLLKFKVVEEAGMEPVVTEVLTKEKIIDLDALFGSDEAPSAPVEAEKAPETTKPEYTQGNTPMVRHSKEL